MTELPNFWRTEIWHPLAVHLPLVLLIFSTLFSLLGLIIKSNMWSTVGRVLLIIGTAGAWVSIYTGKLADAIVVRGLCDPTVLEAHEHAAYWVGSLFTGASLLALLGLNGKLLKIRTVLSVVMIICMLIGSAVLVRTGHLGAQLVYQQAAGVYTPSADCNEFSE